jgi:hypothetical protein
VWPCCNVAGRARFVARLQLDALETFRQNMKEKVAHELGGQR